MAADEPDPATLADVDRDVMALLRSLVDGDWEQQTAILNGAEHGGTLRGVTENLLGATGQPFLRYLLALACAEEQGTPVWRALNEDLGILLAEPVIRGTLGEILAGLQARVVRSGI